MTNKKEVSNMEEKEVLVPQEEKEIIIKTENLGISFRGLKSVQNFKFAY